MARKLRVAVQMDPMDSINIDGDSSFALMLEAQVRGHELWHYEVRHMALKEGVSQAQLDALPAWEGSDLFDERERAVLAYTDAMTRTVQVPDPVFAAVRAAFDDRMLVELTATVAAYNMVSRFLEALQVHTHDAPDHG